ncbi:MAG: DegT/DnrJ/EryC1/StrS family aminotransferase [Candidatus Micrarchaeia archaeon]
MEKPAIEGGKPVRKEFLPFSLPWLGEEEEKAVVAVLRSGWITTGSKTAEFEEKFAKSVGAKHAVAVSSATAALHLSLVATGIGKGDEVITSPYTFCATAHVIEYTGAKTVLADVQKDTFNIDPKEIEKKITPKTRAIMPVHYAGHPCDMKEIREIAEKHDLHIIEDAAHAAGTEYDGKRIGAESEAACYSFYANKQLTTAEGGMLVTNDDAIADKARSLRLFGIDKDAWKRYTKSGKWYYEVKALGFKYNMTDIQAALGLEQLKKIEEFVRLRSKLAEFFSRELGSIEGLTIPRVKPGVKHGWYLYPLLLNLDELKIDRAKFIEAMAAENLGCSVHFVPIHLHPYYAQKYGWTRGDFPVAEWLYDREVSIPFFPKMSGQDSADVVEAVKKIVGYYRR